MSATITVEISRNTIDPEGLASDAEYAAAGEHILDAVRTAFPGADVRAVGNGGRTSGVDADGRDLTRDVRATVNAAFDEWCAASAWIMSKRLTAAVNAAHRASVSATSAGPKHRKGRRGHRGKRNPVSAGYADLPACGAVLAYKRHAAAGHHVPESYSLAPKAKPAKKRAAKKGSAKKAAAKRAPKKGGAKRATVKRGTKNARRHPRRTTKKSTHGRARRHHARRSTR